MECLGNRDPWWSLGSGPNKTCRKEMKMRITLCGSTKFKEEFEATNKKLTMNGHTVYTVMCFGHADKINFSTREKSILDTVHIDKIANSDAIVVIDKDKYIGESTMREINFAKINGKHIFYLSEALPRPLLEKTAAQVRRPNPGCGCEGRGWFTGDMMGSYFIPCTKCNTHEVSGTEVNGIGLKEGCEDLQENITGEPFEEKGIL